ncbi:MAG: hypothetical protein ACRDEB_03590 [Chitinophagaceae bacterium]
MKNIVYTLGAVLLFSTLVSAQAYEGKTEYNKKKQDAFIIEFHYPPQAVENAIIKSMEDMGYKGKEEKGIFNKDRGARVYKNAVISEISKRKFDYIIQIDRKSRKESDEAVMYLIIMDNETNATAGFDAADMKSAKAFLNNLLPEVEAANLEIQINDQEEAVAKAEKRLKDLQSTQLELEKKLEDNKKNQEDTKNDIDTQKHILDGLKLKSKTN